MLDHLIGLRVRVFNAQVTGAKPLQVQSANWRFPGTSSGSDEFQLTYKCPAAFTAAIPLAFLVTQFTRSCLSTVIRPAAFKRPMCLVAVELLTFHFAQYQGRTQRGGPRAGSLDCENGNWALEANVAEATGILPRALLRYSFCDE